MAEKPLGFGYQVGAGAIAGVSEVSVPGSRIENGETTDGLFSLADSTHVCPLTPIDLSVADSSISQVSSRCG